ncbi:energy transducer TonB, partial [Xanthomonas arboricola]
MAACLPAPRPPGDNPPPRTRICTPPQPSPVPPPPGAPVVDVPEPRPSAIVTPPSPPAPPQPPSDIGASGDISPK